MQLNRYQDKAEDDDRVASAGRLPRGEEVQDSQERDKAEGSRVAQQQLEIGEKHNRADRKCEEVQEEAEDGDIRVPEVEGTSAEDEDYLELCSSLHSSQITKAHGGQQELLKISDCWEVDALSGGDA